MSLEIVLAIIVTSIATYSSRFLGLLTSEKINEKSKRLIKEGKKIYQFGFGQSPFQIPNKIVETLKANAHRKEYLPIQGLPKLRDKIS